jgi:hypothetical protein
MEMIDPDTVEGAAMSGQARRIAAILSSRDTSDGLYQAVRLEDQSYVLIRGGNPVHQRDVLPFEPGNGAEIHHYGEINELEAAWADCMDDIENSELMLGRPDAPAGSARPGRNHSRQPRPPHTSGR